MATIDANGIVTAMQGGGEGTGQATITVTLGTVSGNGTVTVTPPPPLTITTTALPGGAAGALYSATLTATGGTPPYSWTIASGLPPGLTLNASTGAISGTPTTAGTYAFTVEVDAGVQSDSKDLSITVTTAVQTIWPSTTVPGLADGGPDSAVELGVKFRSDVAGFIFGGRCYSIDGFVFGR